MHCCLRRRRPRTKGTLCLVGIAETWHLGADYRTATGEQRTVTLSDGSTIHLNTATALSAEFTSGARRLVLYEGEAFFSVAPDPQRPFEVVAGPALQFVTLSTMNWGTFSEIAFGLTLTPGAALITLAFTLSILVLRLGHSTHKGRTRCLLQRIQYGKGRHIIATCSG